MNAHHVAEVAVGCLIAFFTLIALVALTGAIISWEERRRK